MVSITTDENVQGNVFNVQHYCIHDGPGIRTTVFLKGCPLRCLWCQNPESQTAQRQVFFSAEKCSGCGQCISYCTTKAIILAGGRAKTDRLLCNGCGRCIEVCPHEARSIIGIKVSADEIFLKVWQDKIFYDGSGGGVTLSGGEPLAQPEFAACLLKKCKEAGIHTAVETCAYANWQTACRVFQYTDLILLDLKHMDPAEHEKLTGVSNSIILENAKKIQHQLRIPIWARVPVIPNYNDSDENVAALAKFVASELDPAVKVYLLPFHRLGESKKERLENGDDGFSCTPPSDQRMEELKRLVESFGLTVQIGG